MPEVNFLVKKGLTVPKGSAATPAVIFDDSDSNTGLYSPGADQLALSTGGSARLFVDSSGNVGIGDTAPLAQLSIRNVSGTNGFYITRGTSTSFGDVVSLRIFTSVSDSRFYGYGDAMSFWTAATGGTALERLSITSAGLVGIGTSAPAKNLHISSSSNTALRIADTGTAATTFEQTNAGLELVGGNANTSAKYMPGIKFGSTDSAFTTTTPKFGAAITAEATEAYDADTDGGMSLAFWTTPNDPGTSGSLQQRLTILNSGNVGIGTTTPNQDLDLRNAGSTAVFQIISGAALTTSTSTIQLVAFSSASAVAGTARINSTAPAGGQSELSFLTSPTGNAPVERARIDSSGRLLVGTSSAVTTSYSSGLIQLATPTGGIIVTSRDDSTVGSSTIIGGLSLWSKTTTNHEECASIFAQADGTYADGDKPTRLVFSTTAGGAASPTERMRIDSAGFVGVGTNSPGALFDLAANNDGATGTTAKNTLRFTDLDTNTAADQPIGKIEWYSADTSSPGARAVSYILSAAAGTNSGGDIRFGVSTNTGTATERMRITSAGLVGIGTTSPNASSLLDVTSTTQGFLPPRMTTTQRNAISSPAAGLMVYNTTTNKLNFYNGTAWEAVTSA